MSNPRRSATGYMREVENLKRELNNMRRFNEILIVLSLILVIALIAQWAFYQNDMATLQQYHDKYGSIEMAEYWERYG